MNKLIALFLIGVATALASGQAHAQQPAGAGVVTTCGVLPYTANPGSTIPLSVDTAGNLCQETGAVTGVAPNASSVATGGTAVTALTAAQDRHGGFINNPSTATEVLCINIVTTATTTPSGSTVCIPAGTTFPVPPTTLPVSVNAATSGHAFSAVGYP